MSMISAQIDELRKWADLYDGTAKPALSAELQRPYLAHGLRDASDTIQQLRDDLQRANDAVRDAEHEESRAWDRVRKAEAENAKLRGLVEDMLDCIDIQIEFERVPARWMQDEFAGRACELGIEVD